MGEYPHGFPGPTANDLTRAKLAALRVEREKGIMEALTNWQRASAERKRARILAYPDPHGEPRDITEDVVSVLDRLTSTLDWGSGFFDDDDLASFFRLADLLKIDVPDSVERPPNV